MEDIKDDCHASDTHEIEWRKSEVKPRDTGADLSVSHQCGVFSHQDVGAEEEDEGVAEAQEGPVQKGFEGQHGIFTDVSDEGKEYYVILIWRENENN